MHMPCRSACNCLMLMDPGCFRLPGFVHSNMFGGSRLMKIPQECCHTLGVLLKTNRFISHSNAGAGMENANVYRS